MLTGKFRAKSKLFGGFTIEVQEEVTNICPYDLTQDPTFTRWRKATLKDLSDLDIAIA